MQLIGLGRRGDNEIAQTSKRWQRAIRTRGLSIAGQAFLPLSYRDTQSAE